MRNAITPRIAYYFPRSETGFQLHYRYYFDFYPGDAGTPSDPWLITAHTSRRACTSSSTPTLEMRLRCRYYRQSHADFWCDGATGRPRCRPRSSARWRPIRPPATWTPRLLHRGSEAGPGAHRVPGGEADLGADALRTVPFLRWFAAGTFEISYGHYFQNDSFGNAHVLQTGYTLPILD